MVNFIILELSTEIERSKKLSEFFRGKERYKKKIFVNKLGPVFSNKKGEFNKKVQIDKTEDAEINKNQISSSIFFSKKVPFPQEYYQKLYNNFSGFTFGTKTHKKINLREKRKAELKEVQHSFDDVFGNFQNITNAKFYKKKKSSLEKRSKTTDKIFKPTKKKTEYKIIPKAELIKKNEEETLKKQNNKDYSRPQKEKKETISYYDELKRKKYGPEPGPGSFEVAGTIQLNKGYTFGTKSNLIDLQIKTAPAYVLLPSDFENIEEHAT